MRYFFLASSIVLFALGCQEQAQKAQHWVDTPIATTQPGQAPAPTHGQVIQIAGDTAGTVGGPWGLVISGIVTGGLLLLKHVAEQPAKTKQLSTSQAALAVVNDVAATVDAIATNTPVHPSAAVAVKPTVK